MSLTLIFLLLSVAGNFAEQNDGSLPQALPVVVTGSSGSCPSASTQETTRNGILEQVESIVSNTVANQPPCPCNIPGLWTRIAHLNMSDPDEVCPPNWNIVTDTVRGCTRSTLNDSATDSAIFPANGRTYSRVCGKINAFQKGIPDGFAASTFYNRGIQLDGPYLDGVSITHGEVGSRQHIWSFVVTRFEGESFPNFACNCINELNVAHAVPAFVGNNYFCATGNEGYPNQTELYLNDPLWDGEGCGTTNTCCEFNNPPYFCTMLPQPTTDDIEVRICHDEPEFDENTIVSLMDIYVL